jgi:hypothetical protein
MAPHLDEAKSVPRRVAGISRSGAPSRPGHFFADLHENEIAVSAQVGRPLARPKRAG